MTKMDKSKRYLIITFAFLLLSSLTIVEYCEASKKFEKGLLLGVLLAKSSNNFAKEIYWPRYDGPGCKLGAGYEEWKKK